jgi:hypothetical protein
MGFIILQEKSERAILILGCIGRSFADLGSLAEKVHDIKA